MRVFIPSKLENSNIEVKVTHTVNPINRKKFSLEIKLNIMKYEIYPYHTVHYIDDLKEICELFQISIEHFVEKAKLFGGIYEFNKFINGYLLLFDSKKDIKHFEQFYIYPNLLPFCKYS